MTKNRLQFSLIIVSIIAMFICSCSPKSRTKKDTQQDSANTQSNTPSINVDSMAATIDTTSYTNTSRYNEEDENMDKDEDYEDYVLYKFKEEEPFTIEKEDDCFVIKGEKVEKLFKMTKFSTEEGMLRFAKKLRKMGIDEKLEEMGAEDGDMVRILDFYFEFKKN